MKRKDIKEIISKDYEYKGDAIYNKNSHDMITFHYNNKDNLESIIRQQRANLGGSYYGVFLSFDNLKDVEFIINEFKEEFKNNWSAL